MNKRVKTFISVALCVVAFQCNAIESCIGLDEAKVVAKNYEFPNYDNGFSTHMNDYYIQEGVRFEAEGFPKNFFKATSRKEFQEALNLELEEDFLSDTSESFYYFRSEASMMGCRISAELYVLCDGETRHTSHTWSCW